MIASSTDSSAATPSPTRPAWLRCSSSVQDDDQDLPETVVFTLDHGWQAHWFYPLTRGLDAWSALPKTENLFLSEQYLAMLAQTVLPGLETGLLIFRKEDIRWGAVIQQFTFSAAEQLAAFTLDSNAADSSWRQFRQRSQHRLARFLQWRSLMAGNMLLTSKHSCRGNWPSADQKARLLTEALEAVAAATPQRIHALLLKDVPLGSGPEQRGYHNIPVQPNMVLSLDPRWESEQDYLAAMSSKYRVRTRRARKKGASLHRRSLSHFEIVHYQDKIYSLYRQIADGADYNAVQLPPAYFSVWKERFPDQFQLWGYFQGEALVGFSTAIQNEATLEAHYLGFDATINRATQLYLNMLYDLVGEGIRRGVEEVNLSRTALEIKSSIGAKPEDLQVWVHSRVGVVRPLVSRLAKWLSPTVEWEERHPFK
jgi:hypothetical protein